MKPKAGRPRIYDYPQIVRMFRKYQSKRRVAKEYIKLLGLDEKEDFDNIRRTVQKALEQNAKKLLSLPVDNHIVKADNKVKTQ